MRARRHPPAGPYAVLLLLWGAGNGLFAAQAVAIARSSAGGPALLALGAVLALVVLAQAVGSFFLLGALAKGLAYAFSRPRPAPEPALGTPPPTVVLYLTAGDFDPVAVDSLLRLESRGPLLFLLHDDGDDEHARARMRAFVEAHPERARWEFALWHRPRRLGGKAGAVNWVLDRLEARWTLLLLCDSDSIALDRDAIRRACGEFSDGGVSVVQFRNAGWSDENEPELQRGLARAIDVFDALATPQSEWGYLPFFGHNALLRIADLRRFGGLTPGFFSDDLDYSIRLSLAGRRIVYRRDLRFGERHPADWIRFRKRARKWALGCMQVVRTRARAVLVTPGVPFAQRVGMLEFMGFYPAQALLLAGLLAGQLLLPWLAPAATGSAAFTASGAIVLLALLAPTLSWAIRERRLREWPGLAWSCALVYGGSLPSTVRGVLEGLSRRERPWVPTNLAGRGRAIPLSAWAESLLGIALVAVPWIRGDRALAFPATYLFVATFLFSPLTFLSYRESATAEPSPSRRDRPAGPAREPGTARAAPLVGLLLVAGLATPLAATPAGAARDLPPVQARGAALIAGGAPFEVRGVHYSPWLPGTGPDGHSPYPSRSVVGRDLAAIHDLGANTVLLENAPAWVIDEARAHGLRTIYAFDLAWNDTSRAAFDRQAAALVSGLDSLRGHAGVFAWILGHELPPWVVSQLGAREIESRLRDLAARVRARDPGRLLGHGNWPPTKDLDLSFLDLSCFNLYPAWPYEVTVRGYGPYLREVLAPLARGRPLLITEFGINSLEASEARQALVLADCWTEIHAGPAVGGVVFEWCDEWWKNWDNPIPGKGYWERRYDPTDAARHDADPEEYYGIVGADRHAKPALAAVARMWRAPAPARAWTPWLVLAGLALLTWFAFGLHRRPRRHRAAARAALVAVAGGLLLVAPGARAASLLTETYWSPQSNAQFGWQVAGAGNLSGTGPGVAAIGAHFFSPSSADTAAGAVYLYLGGNTTPTGSPPWRRLDGISPHEHFSEGLAGGADVDGDGLPDLAVGAPLRGTNGLSANGAVDLFRGGAVDAGPYRTFSGEASDDWLGESVALGDLDGDGKAEIIVGAPYNDRGGSAAGAVFIWKGGAPAGSPPWKILVGEAANDQFGWSVAYVGDVNGDGYGDIVVGARLHTTLAKSSCGRAYLFEGGPQMSTTAAGHWDGEVRDDWFGQSVAGPGDVDGGGRPDILIGAPYNDRGGSAAGAAYLFRGEDPPGSPPIAVFVGAMPNAQLGWAVGAPGDVNDDGRPDVVAGARLQASGVLSAAGRVYLYAGGATVSPAAMDSLDGRAANDWMGNAVGGAAGFFNPGRSGAIGGAPYSDLGALDAGSAVLAEVAVGAAVDPVPLVRGTVTAQPNPSRGAVRLAWVAPGFEAVRFRITDLQGRLVALVPAGRGGSGVLAAWDGRDATGHLSAPGLYLVRAETAAGPVPGLAPSRILRLR